jgi:hypothetical protein
MPRWKLSAVFENGPVRAGRLCPLFNGERLYAMRNGQQKRMRGRNRNRNQNPLTRVYESNGPDVKVRGTAHHIAEKYIQLARDAQASGDPVSSEGYLQHAEHYFRLIAAAQAQFAQQNPHQPQPTFQRSEMEGSGDFDDGEGDDGSPGDPNAQPYAGGAPVQPVHHQQRQQNAQHQPQPNFQGQPHQRSDPQNSGSLPAFITGGGGSPQGHGYEHDQANRGNRNDRFGRNRNRNFRHGGGNYDNRGGHQGDGQSQQGPVGQNPVSSASPSQSEVVSRPPEGNESTESSINPKS